MSRRVAAWACAFALGLAAGRASAEIKVDGRLDEPEWDRAQVFTDFRVTQPYTLGSPRHPTEVRLLGTPEGILVGFHCMQPASTPRQKEQTPRDTDNNGDRVNIYIDLDADAKVAYNVTIALAGSLQDATITNENLYSTDWDGDYLYAVRDLEDEWFVELLLPWTLASMKNPGTPKRTVGIVFDRVIAETQERSALEGKSFTRPRYLSEFPKVEIDQYQSSLFHVFPYATAASDLLTDESDLKFGADILWKPSGSFQLTAALNPDFGQVEADELVVNFNAIEVLFSDKRPFFAENQALFDVRLAGNDRLIYTRRVGGPRDDDPARRRGNRWRGEAQWHGRRARLRPVVRDRARLQRRHRPRLCGAAPALERGRLDRRISRRVHRQALLRPNRAGACNRLHLAPGCATLGPGAAARQ